MNHGKKGRKFEIDVCRQLSLWWSFGEDDSIFWHTHGSGSMATRRGRKGKKTHGQCGDICATSPLGLPLLKLVVFELKRGYQHHHFNDLLDGVSGEEKLDEWFAQAKESRQHAGSMSWMIVHRKLRRKAVVYAPKSLLEKLKKQPSEFNPYLYFRDGRTQIVAFHLERFLEIVHPDEVKSLVSFENFGGK